MKSEQLTTWTPTHDRHEEPREVYTLNMTFENEDDWLDMREIIEQWDMGWLTGVYRDPGESANDVIKKMHDGTAKPTSWSFNKNGAYSYETGIAHQRYSREY